jgi:hypothetical protein
MWTGVLADITTHGIVALVGSFFAAFASYLQGRQALRKAKRELKYAGGTFSWPETIRHDWLQIFFALPREPPDRSDPHPIQDRGGQKRQERLDDSDDAPADKATTSSDVDPPSDASAAEAAAGRDAEHFLAVSWQWFFILWGAVLAMAASVFEMAGK